MSERQKETQFGGVRANRRGNPSTAANQREFYRWVESEATEAELTAYVANPANPAARRAFVEVIMRADTIQEFLALTNQVHGMPKQEVQVTELPDIRINLE